MRILTKNFLMQYSVLQDKTFGVSDDLTWYQSRGNEFELFVSMLKFLG
jgi:hypothetical protein